MQKQSLWKQLSIIYILLYICMCVLFMLTNVYLANIINITILLLHIGYTV